MQYKNYPNFLICVKSSKIWKFKRQNKEKIRLWKFAKSLTRLSKSMGFYTAGRLGAAAAKSAVKIVPKAHFT